MPRKLSPRQLAYLAIRREISKRRKWLWKNKRAQMEVAQAKATARATEIRQDVNTIILETVRTWPSTMTPEQLDEHLLMFPYHRKGKKRRMKRASLVRRLRLLGLIEYIPCRNTWVNLCTLIPREDGQPKP
jgi:hypothetical protein